MKLFKNIGRAIIAQTQTNAGLPDNPSVYDEDTRHPAGVVLEFSMDPTPEPNNISSEFVWNKMVQWLKRQVRGRRTYTATDAANLIDIAVGAYAIERSLTAFEKFVSYIQDGSRYGTDGEIIRYQYLGITANDQEFSDKVKHAHSVLRGILNITGVPVRWKEMVDKVIGIKTEDINGEKIPVLSVISFVPMYRATVTFYLRESDVDDIYPYWESVLLQEQIVQLASDMLCSNYNLTYCYNTETSAQRTAKFDDFKLFLSNTVKASSTGLGQNANGQFVYPDIDVSVPGRGPNGKWYYNAGDSRTEPDLIFISAKQDGTIESWQLAGLGYSPYVDDAIGWKGESIFMLTNYGILNVIDAVENPYPQITNASALLEFNTDATELPRLGAIASSRANFIISNLDWFGDVGVATEQGSGTTMNMTTVYIDACPNKYSRIQATDQTVANLVLDLLQELVGELCDRDLAKGE